MVYLFNWLFVVALLALWSLSAAALHAVAVWTVSHVGALAGAAPNAGALVFPDWLKSWVPTELLQLAAHWTTGLATLIDAVLQSAPLLSGSLAALAWVIWGVGSALLLLFGAGLHGLIALWRRPSDHSLPAKQAVGASR